MFGSNLNAHKIFPKEWYPVVQHHVTFSKGYFDICGK